MYCPKCGAQLPDDAAFCIKCGTSLTTSARAAEQKLWDTKCKQYIAGTTAMVFDMISEK